MIKNFPKSRICVIDCYKAFESGLSRAVQFAQKHSISLNSKDGRKIILSYCLKNIENIYKNTKSNYPKVLCISKKAVTNKVQNFVDNHFDKMMSYLPAPYCGKYDLNSPDLEIAAENCLKKEKPKHKFQEFLRNLSIREVK